MPQPTPAPRSPGTQLSRDGTFLLTPEQHRRAAQRLLQIAGQPGAPDLATAQGLAANHEQLAQAIERRDKPN